jgi:hypothetical protein
MKVHRLIGETIGDSGVTAGRILLTVYAEDDDTFISAELATKPAGQRVWGPPIALHYDHEA